MCLFIFPKFREAIIIRIMKKSNEKLARSMDNILSFRESQNFLNDVISKQERP